MPRPWALGPAVFFSLPLIVTAQEIDAIALLLDDTLKAFEAELKHPY